MILIWEMILIGFNWITRQDSCVWLILEDSNALAGIITRRFYRYRNLIVGPITNSEPGSFIERIFQATRLALRFAPRQIARKKRFGNQFRLVMHDIMLVRTQYVLSMY